MIVLFQCNGQLGDFGSWHSIEEWPEEHVRVQAFDQGSKLPGSHFIRTIVGWNHVQTKPPNPSAPQDS